MKKSKIREKYDICDLELKASSDEYIVQNSFGWANDIIQDPFNARNPF